MKDLYSVFYLVGGYSNFVCQAVVGRHTLEIANGKVAEINRMGYKAMAVKDGHLVGGYCSHTDFATKEEAKAYYYSV